MFAHAPFLSFLYWHVAKALNWYNFQVIIFPNSPEVIVKAISSLLAVNESSRKF